MKNTVFDTEIELKYNLYNSLFLTLPIDGINNTGIRIPILHEYCKSGMKAGENPTEIISRFFKEQPGLTTSEDQTNFMFRVIQYIERQVVLVDALEDASYDKINDVTGAGSFKYLADQAKQENLEGKLHYLLKDFSTRTVLTAHPTQFYPGSVLGIITDLATAVSKNDLENVQKLLQQLGKTPFFQKEKPTPFDEAMSLIWYLENVFYQATKNLIKMIKSETEHSNNTSVLINEKIFVFGFWPGGDRDGNPFVNTDTTLKVANRLRFSIIRNYYRDIRKLRRKLTFKGIFEKIQEIEHTLFKSIIDNTIPSISLESFIDTMEDIKLELHNSYNGLYEELVTSFIYQLKIFGYFFASIDIRQDSRVINKTLSELTDKTTVDDLFNSTKLNEEVTFSEPVLEDTFSAIKVIKEIQNKNGVLGAHRYIISNSRSAIDVANVFAMASMAGWEKPYDLDIVPLFETIEDLENAANTMLELYQHPIYRPHLKYRNNRQSIMLGFSDGTKDGGYLSANWNIYKAKESMTKVSRQQGIEVVFFDGRGGPPARGGGNTHKFYASLGNEIENKEIQLTIQGQTISSNFGTTVSAHHNLELLMTAGLQNQLFELAENQLSDSKRAVIEQLSQISLDTYKAFKAHKKFVPYLEEMSALKYYGMAKIGSRPSKRNQSDELKFEDLRAIPFVGAWSQLKQNVPGFYGVGSALKQLENEGKIEDMKLLYKESSFFRALIENSAMSLMKTYFPLTDYMKNDIEFGNFWKIIYNEYLISKEMVLKVSGQTELLETSHTSRASIALREKIILPLVIIQQYALMKIREFDQKGNEDLKIYDTYQKIVVRSLYGNINASRNSA